MFGSWGLMLVTFHTLSVYKRVETCSYHVVPLLYHDQQLLKSFGMGEVFTFLKVGLHFLKSCLFVFLIIIRNAYGVFFFLFSLSFPLPYLFLIISFYLKLFDVFR